MPTNQNVDRIIKDFTNNKQYAAAHLFFIEGKSLTTFTENIHSVDELNTGLYRPRGILVPEIDEFFCGTASTSSERIIH
jgi:hypothetical protein